MRFIRPAAAAFVLALAAACSTIPLPRLKDGPEVRLERKPLVGKRQPAQLVAEDGTTCQTTEARFKRARTGQRVWCMWRGEPFTGETRTGPDRGGPFERGPNGRTGTRAGG